mgnify:CR=1 FL=1
MTLDKEDIYDIAKAVVKVIEDKDMMKSEKRKIKNRVRIASLAAGNVFQFADKEWIVLNQNVGDETCFCIVRDFLLDSHCFSEYDNKWERSSLRSDLDSIKYEIEEYGAEEGLRPNDILKYFPRNLMALDGANASEECSDKISLLTLDEYRLYRAYLDYPSKAKKLIEWALLTPETNIDTRGVCAVHPDGSVVVCCVAKQFNIRPVCLFNSNIYVEKVDS